MFVIIICDPSHIVTDAIGPFKTHNAAVNHMIDCPGDNNPREWWDVIEVRGVDE